MLNSTATPTSLAGWIVATAGAFCGSRLHSATAAFLTRQSRRGHSGTVELKCIRQFRLHRQGDDEEKIDGELGCAGHVSYSKVFRIMIGRNTLQYSGSIGDCDFRDESNLAHQVRMPFFAIQGAAIRGSSTKKWIFNQSETAVPSRSS